MPPDAAPGRAGTTAASDAVAFDSSRAAASGAALAAVAADAARLLLGLDPVLGDDGCQAAVDAFVEEAARALAALAAASRP